MKKRPGMVHLKNSWDKYKARLKCSPSFCRWVRRRRTWPSATPGPSSNWRPPPSCCHRSRASGPGCRTKLKKCLLSWIELKPVPPVPTSLYKQHALYIWMSVLSCHLKTNLVLWVLLGPVLSKLQRRSYTIAQSLVDCCGSPKKFWNQFHFIKMFYSMNYF